MKRLSGYFVRGLVVLLPIVTTIWVLTNVFKKIDDAFPFPAPGLGFALAIGVVLLIGWLCSMILGRWIEQLTDWAMSEIPLVGSIYGTVKDVLKAVGGEKKTFDRPVVVTLFPGGTAKVLGFVTRDDLSEIGLPGEVAVLLQQSLNFAGNILIFPKAQIRALEVDAGKFMTFVMSGGLTGDLSARPATAQLPAPPK